MSHPTQAELWDKLPLFIKSRLLTSMQPEIEQLASTNMPKPQLVVVGLAFPDGSIFRIEAPMNWESAAPLVLGH